MASTKGRGEAVTGPSPEGRTYAFRVGYLADGFQGYARQPGLPTVEGTIRQGLLHRGVLAPEDGSRFRSASRTDRGVHALGNVVSFPTRLRPEAAARALDSLDARIFCSGFALVEPSFHPRHARERWYRYLAPAEGHDLDHWKACATLFEGEHEFASFSRRDEPPRPTRGTLREVHVSRQGPHLLVDLRAPSFLWNQVRKVVSALEGLDRGTLALADVRAALHGRKVLHLPLAPPGGLVLMEVSYDFPFQRTRLRETAQRRRLLEEGRREARTRETLLGWFQSRTLLPPSATSDP